MQSVRKPQGILRLLLSNSRVMFASVAIVSDCPLAWTSRWGRKRLRVM